MLEEKLNKLKKGIEENESRIKIVYYFNEYDKAYQNTPKSESRYYEYIDTYFMFLDYMNKTKRKGLK